MTDVVALRPADLLVTHGSEGPRLWIVDASGAPRSTDTEPLPAVRSALVQATVASGTMKELYDAAKGKRSAEEIAKAAGMSRSGLYFVLDGRNVPKPTTAVSIARALDVPVRDVWLAMARTHGMDVDA